MEGRGGIVAELRALLTNARLTTPYILVGHSFGVFNTRLFAYTYPAEVAALVLVDVAHEDQLRLFPASVRRFLDRYSHGLCLQSQRAIIGIERFRGVTAADTMAAAPQQRRLLVTLGYRTAWYRAQCAEFLALGTSSADQVRTARRALPIPVYVLDGNAHFAQELRGAGVPPRDADSAATVWHALHRELMTISLAAHLIVAERSSHYVQFDQPELVLQTIADAVGAVRAQRAR